MESPWIKEFGTLEKLYEHFCEIPSDIHQHLPLLKEYASKCKTVTEFGFRTAYSCAALLMGKPKHAVSYDILDNWDGVKYPEYFTPLVPKGVDWKFVQANTLLIDIAPTEFLFVDTLHTKTQLAKELKRHASKVSRFIGFHDTISFGHYGEDGSSGGLMDSINEFLENNQEWTIVEHKTNNNGLTIIGRN